MVEARGSTTGGFRAGDVIRGLLARRALVRFGGISLVVAGVTGISADLLSAWLMGDSVLVGPVDGTEWLWTLSDSLGLSGELLVVVGLAGLYALLAERRGVVGVLARVGFLLVAVFTVGYVGY